MQDLFSRQIGTTTSPYRVRGRILFFYLAASFIATTVFIAMLWPSWLDQSPPPPLPNAVSGLVWYTLLLALLFRPVRRSGTSLRTIFGSRPTRAAMCWAITAGLALLGTSLASLYVVYLPLSYAVPEYVQWWLIEDQMVFISTHGHLYLLANCVNFLVMVLLGPFVEEIFFRGLLLPSWASRWSPTRGVIFSSLLFAVLHPDILGSFIFGAVASVVFLKTGSLWLPFVIHATNNALVWIVVGGELLILGESTYTLADFQGSWWLGAVGLFVGLPLLLEVMRRVPKGPRGIALPNEEGFIRDI